ncbi:segregation/condensation protein A [Fenollaria sporofastidiosus]|uniref:segregation/condensation protein A n=1 Tax=Fenollaria sporofastidiosus TaxID=2811778 RepID=UPI001BFFE56A
MKLSEFIPDIVDVAYVITLFISVLELIQSKIISYEQESTFSDINFTYMGDERE